MKVIEPITIDDAVFVSSDVPENDHAEWDVSTTYAEDDEVIVLSTHKVYRSVQGSNLGNDPTTDDGTWWTDFGATNRWQAFDALLHTQTTQADSIEYVLNLSDLVDGIALFNLTAETVRVEVRDDGSPTATVFYQTYSMADNSEVIDFYTWYFAPIERRDRLIPTVNMPGRNGFTVRVTITNTGATAGVGLLVIGRVYNLGITTAGTGVSYVDYSEKDRDEFGNPVITPRPYADQVTYRFMADLNQIERIRRRVAANRNRPAVWLIDAGTEQFGTTVYGIVDRFDAGSLQFGKTTCLLEIEGFA